jgi:hypothetical protein
MEKNGITLKSALCCRISSILVWTSSEHCLSSKRKVEIKILNLSPLLYKNDNFEETPLCYRKLQNGICWAIYSEQKGVFLVRNWKSKLQFSGGHILGNRMLKIIGKLFAQLLGNLLICFVVYILYKSLQYILMQGTDIFLRETFTLQFPSTECFIATFPVQYTCSVLLIRKDKVFRWHRIWLHAPPPPSYLICC